MENPSLVRLGGERKEVSILFSDIRGFTSLSEDLNPEEVVELLNEYFKEMTEVIFESEGTLDKFIGDAIMVFWGAPLPQDDHAIRAVQCAVNMLEKLKPLKDKWKKEKKSGSGYWNWNKYRGSIGWKYWCRRKENGLYCYWRPCKSGLKAGGFK